MAGPRAAPRSAAPAGSISAGAGAIATKAAGALAAAAIVTAGAVEATHTVHHPARPIASVQQAPLAPDAAARPVPVPDHHLLVITHRRTVKARPAALKSVRQDDRPPPRQAEHRRRDQGQGGGQQDGPGVATPRPRIPARVQTADRPDRARVTGDQPSTGTTGTTGASGTTTAAPASSSDATTGSSSATTGPTGPSGTSTTGSSAATSPAPPTDTAGGAQTDPGNAPRRTAGDEHWPDGGRRHDHHYPRDELRGGRPAPTPSRA